jgi:hypothetical protein
MVTEKIISENYFASSTLEGQKSISRYSVITQTSNFSLKNSKSAHEMRGPFSPTAVLAFKTTNTNQVSQNNYCGTTRTVNFSKMLAKVASTAAP